MVCFFFHTSPLEENMTPAQLTDERTEVQRDYSSLTKVTQLVRRHARISTPAGISTTLG